ncbi:MAG: T9SS type A sorting domain-containing protein [Bacteroidia bacterium]
MKKSLRLITAFCFGIIIYCSSYHVADAQYVTIPDPNFANWLYANGFASCMNGNQLDTTCNAVITEWHLYLAGLNITDLEGVQYFDNLSVLECSDNPLSNLPILPVSLTYLFCNNDQLTSIPYLPSFITNLYCSNNLITLLPSLPPNLVELACSGNKLSGLPALPSSLQSLACGFSDSLSSFPVLPNSLRTLYCDYCPILALPSSLPDSLRIFICEHSQLYNLPSLPDSLNELRCGSNLLTSLPALPPGLVKLDCSENSLLSLPTLPGKLTQLKCFSNQLTNIPVFPNSLNLLYIDSNFIASLPPLPNSIMDLSCNHNQLISLPALPNSLLNLFCSFNQLITLPVLPNSLNSLDCSNNQIGALPDLPDSMSLLVVGKNPSLTCLPKLNKISWLAFDSTGITCIPNYGNVITSNPLLSSLPLCDLFNTNGCTAFWNISGNVYEDTNNNCISELSEPKFANLKLMLYDSTGNLTQQTFTGVEGLYSFDTDTGTFTYTIDTINLPVLVACPVSGIYTSVLTAIDSMDYDMNFGMQCKPGFDIGANAVVRDSGIFRPANFANVIIKAGDISNKYGFHCASGISGDVKIVINGDVSYVSACPGSLIPVVNGDTLTYSIADFGTINFDSDFRIIVQTDTFATIGNQICFEVNVTPTSGDNNPSNNNLQNCFTVVGSFDPNDKTVYPANRIEDKNGTLTYTINFQNTGTAPAQHIYILDTLDAAIDESSFELLAYSHQPLVQLIGNVVRFNFPNINLPDSVSDEPNSHGYVQYRVKLKDSLSKGTIIQNTSYIYFDFNAPVQTNTVVDTLTDCNNLASIQFTNPNFCNGDTVFANAVLGYNSNTDWYVDSVFVSNNQNIFIPNLTIGNHEIKLVASNAYCNVEVVSNIVYHDLPVVDLGNDTATCNVSVQLDAGAVNISYQWSNGETTQSIIATATNNYSVVVTDANGCVNSDSVNIVVNPLPTIELGNDTATCNASVQLDAGSGNILYQWSNGETTQTIIATATNNYSVVVTDANGCSNADSISITINALPVVTLNAFPNSDTLCISSGVQTISNGNPIGGTLSGTGVSGNNFNPALAGVGWNVILYSYTDSNGCTNIATDSVFVDLCLGVNSISGNETINIYPNPATDEITISYNFKNASHIKIELYNSIGEKIKVLVDEKYQVAENPQGFKNLAGLGKGIYLVKVSDDENVFVKKLVVE